MKKVHLLFACFTLLVACGSLDSPKKVAAAFVENVAHGKIDKAMELATESTGKVLSFGAMMKMPVYPDYKFIFLRDSVVNNEAWVFYRNVEKQEDSVHLIKVDGKWKVHMENRK